LPIESRYFLLNNAAGTSPSPTFLINFMGTSAIMSTVCTYLLGYRLPCSHIYMVWFGLVVTTLLDFPWTKRSSASVFLNHSSDTRPTEVPPAGLICFVGPCAVFLEGAIEDCNADANLVINQRRVASAFPIDSLIMVIVVCVGFFLVRIRVRDQIVDAY
jgi:hypothetical protein